MQSRFRVLAVGCLALLLAGCATRSISDPGYRPPNPYGQPAANPLYHGELTPFQVLGIDPQQKITQDDIDKALAAKQPMVLRKGSALMLVQSGAPMPDNDMMEAMQRYYVVSGFSGVPTDSSLRDGKPQTEAGTYALMFRLAAAKGGYEKIVVYWGELESLSESMGTKAVSWVPIIGGIIPDESQKMRIKLNLALIDVRSGQWETFSPPAIEDDAISNQHNRAGSDQAQVALLKTKAYQKAVEILVNRYAR